MAVMRVLSFLLRMLGTLAFFAGSFGLFGATVGKDVWTNTLWSRGVRAAWALEPIPLACVVLLVAAAVMMTVGAILDRKPPTKSESHGSARFATTEELRTFGYTEAAVGAWFRLLVSLGYRSYPHIRGVVVGQENSAELEMFLGPRGSPAFRVKKSAPLIVVREHHVAVEGPPGSGKDVSIALPSLWYDHGRSVVVLDPKGNQYEKTAGARSAFSHVIRFAPTEKGSDKINPLCVIPVGTDAEVTEAEQISNALLGVMKDEKDPSTFYSKSAQPLLTAAILYALNKNTGKDRSLPGAFDVLGRKGLAKDIVHTIAAGLPKSARYLADMLGTMAKDNKTLQSMFTTAMNALDFCRYPAVREALSGSDFVPSDLFTHQRPCSLYLVVPFKYADALKPLMRLMLNILVSSHVAKRNHDTCYYLNEFPSIGAVPAIPRAAAEIREYGVQFVLFWQSEGQIMATYGKDAGQTILDTCRARVILGVSGRLASENASAMIGKTTIVRQRATEAVSVKSFLERTRTHTKGEGEQARELLTPDEVRSLPPDKALIWLPYVRPYQAVRCVSYSQPRFKRALNIPAPAPYRARQEASNAR